MEDFRRGPERLLTARQVAEWLGVSMPWVMQHAAGRRRPHLPSLKMGKVIRFRREAVEKFLDECDRLAESKRLKVAA